MSSFTGHAMKVENSTDVVLSELELYGNAAHTDMLGNDVPSNGLLAGSGSSIVAFDCVMLGSRSNPAISQSTIPLRGGDGVTVIDSDLRLTRCDLSGGNGSSLYTGSCYVAAEGGSALFIGANGGAAPSVQMLDCTMTEGDPGFFNPGCGPVPPTTPTLVDPLGALVLLTGVARTMTFPNQPNANGYFQIFVKGEPGDLWFLFASNAPTSPFPLAGINGDLFIDATTSFQPYGGVLNFLGQDDPVLNFINPGLPLIFYTQALFLDTAGGFWLTGPSTFVSL